LTGARVASSFSALMTNALRTAWVAAVLALASVSAVEGQAAIVGVVYDSTTRAPVSGAVITVPGTSYSALTSELGEFQLRDLRAGNVTLRISHLAYGERTLSVDIVGDSPTHVRLALSRSAILLEAIEVDVLSEEDRAQRALGTRRSLVTRQQIASLESTNATLADVVRQHIPNVRIRRQERISGAPICIELRTIRAMVNQNECLSPAVYLDGVPIGNPTALYASLDIGMIESIEVVPAAESGVRYGTNALYGALLIETRRPGSGLSPPRVQSLRSYDWSADAVAPRESRVRLFVCREHCRPGAGLCGVAPLSGTARAGEGRNHHDVQHVAHGGCRHCRHHVPVAGWCPGRTTGRPDGSLTRHDCARCGGRDDGRGTGLRPGTDQRAERL
jgi:hypothetical protein